MTLGSTQPPLKQVPGFFSAIKWPGRKVHSSPPYTVEVKNECSCTTIPLYVSMAWIGKTSLRWVNHVAQEEQHKIKYLLKPAIRNHSQNTDVCVRQEDNVSSRRLTIIDSIKLFACYVNIQANNQQSNEKTGHQTHFYSDRHS
jgi:hypothetical protein